MCFWGCYFQFLFLFAVEMEVMVLLTRLDVLMVCRIQLKKWDTFWRS